MSNATTTHKCPAPGCDANVPSDQYACRAHWYALPARLRRAIWHGYRKQPLGPAHVAAMEAAQVYLDGR